MTHMNSQCSTTPAAMSSQGYSPPALAPPPPPSTLQSQALTGEYGSIDLSSYEGGKPSQGTAHSRQPLQESTGNAQYQHHQQHHQHHHHHQHTHQHTQQQSQAPTTHYPTTRWPLPSLMSLNASRSCTPHLQFGGPLIPPPATVPTPPSILQSNATSQHHPHHHAITTTGGGAGGSSSSSSSSAILSAMRLQKFQYEAARQKNNQNPLYACPEFAQYRLKQKDKDRQVWPDDLEEFFQDSLLQIIFMGRRKFYMYNKQHGRNMIISEYIWRRWLETQPNPERIQKVLDESLQDKDPNKYHPMFRKRKQVSSHIQVQKGFFKFHWAYHFLFCKGEEAGKKDKNKPPVPNRWYKENTDTRPLKCDPVLTALEKKQLPTVQPNYEYFRQLLAMNGKVQIRPSTCWIYVANKHLRDSAAVLPATAESTLLLKDETKNIGAGGIKIEDSQRQGPGYTSANPNPNTVLETWHPKKGLLWSSEFPHRYAFNNPSSNDGAESPWALREREVRNIRQTLLHEYTFPLKQTESSAAREVLDEWATEHKDLHDMLQSVIEQHDLHNAHALPAGRLCDIIHVDVTLDIHRVHSLPEGTSFEWPFKINVEQPGLQGHDWRVRTFLDRPVELARHKNVKRKNGMVMTRDEENLMNEMTHVRGCSDDNPQCACRNRHRGPVWLVPIPVNTWAESLDMCAQFPRYLVPKKQDANRKRREEEMPESETVTQMDLMKATAMFQELWSSAPPTPGMGEQQSWTRRAVICWTFNTIHFFDKDKNLCETPSQTSWRFLSAVDPLSQAHQERIYLPASAKNDNSSISPAPVYHQQLLNTPMTDNLSSGWNVPPGGAHSAPASMPVSPMEPYGPSPLNIPGTYANGLVTPPATATLPSTYTFDGLPSVMHSHNLPNHQMSYLPVPSMESKASFPTGDGFDTDPYLQGSQFGTTFYDEGEDNESDTTLPGESTDLAAFETQQWSNLNSAGHAANVADSLDWSHNGLQSLSMVAEEMAGNNRDHKPEALDETAQHLQHPYADPFAHLRAVARERRTNSPNSYVRHGEQSLRNNFDRRAQRGLPVDNHSDNWNTTESPLNGEQAVDSQGYSQKSSAHLSQSTAGAWPEDLSQLHESQPPRDEALAMNEQRALQDYGPGSLGPLLNRKRRRDDDEAEDNDRYRVGPTPSYATRDDVGYAPSVDRQDGNTWS